MDAAVHALSLIGGMVAAVLSMYVSYRLLKNKEEIVAAVKEACPSKDSFEAHEELDRQRFDTLERAEAQRHTELRQDIATAHKRIDGIMGAK